MTTYLEIVSKLPMYFSLLLINLILTWAVPVNKRVLSAY